MKKTLPMHAVLHAPLISEKSMLKATENQFVFRVDARATKTQIRDAVVSLFSVRVRRINTISMTGKVKSFARRGAKTTGRRSDWKKAIVTLAPGQEIVLDGVRYFEQ